MFSNTLINLSYGNTPPILPNGGQRGSTYHAMRLFWKASFRGSLHRLWAWLTRRSARLLDLNETLQQNEINGSYYAGIKTIQMDRICGSQGKVDAFDSLFYPLKEITFMRWVNVAQEKLRGHSLPPVELVEVNGLYYVRDGHHRISVARTLGERFVDAEVTVINLHPSLI